MSSHPHRASIWSTPQGQDISQVVQEDRWCHLAAGCSKRLFQQELSQDSDPLPCRVCPHNQPTLGGYSNLSPCQTGNLPGTEKQTNIIRNMYLAPYLLIRYTASYTQPVVGALLGVLVLFRRSWWTGVAIWQLVRTGGGGSNLSAQDLAWKE